jgi:hypothetical protein
MKKYAKDLMFISQIKRDGSGTNPISKEHLDFLLERDANSNNDEYFILHCLSLTEKTFIAFNFNAYVVRLKEENS